MADPYDHAAHAASFGAAAEAYHRGRPDYPAAALDWLLPEHARQVLDLGAGTGKLTAELVARGLHVTAVEPSAPMLAQLRAAVPDARAVQGAAEALPLADASVDAVLVAQAWHWVDPARAEPEVARVLRPGGTLGLVWNVRRTDGGWVTALDALLQANGNDRGESMGLDELRLGGRFTPLEQHDVQWTHHLGPEQVVDMVASRSYVITSSEPRRQALLDQVRALVATHPDTAGAEQVAMGYTTHCFRAQRR